MSNSVETVALQQARDWLTASDRPLAGLPYEMRKQWFEDASEGHVVTMIDIYYPNKWAGFVERTFQEMVA